MLEHPDDFAESIRPKEYNDPVEDVWTYLSDLNFDFGIWRVTSEYRGGFGIDMWERYREVLDAAPSGKQLVIMPNMKTSYLDSAVNAREVTFYPFDSSQLGGLGGVPVAFNVFGFERDVFVRYEHDSTVINNEPLNYDPNSESPPREAIYNPSSLTAPLLFRMVAPPAAVSA